MRGKRFSEAQIIKVLEEVQLGRQVNDVCREHGVAQSTYFAWRSKYGGMKLSEVHKSKEYEKENSRLKKLLAEAHLDIEALKLVISKK